MFALDLLRGGSFLAWLEGGPDPRFRLSRRQLDRPWYTTFILELPPLPLVVTEIDQVMERETLLQEAAVLFAADSSADVIETEELRGLFLQRGDGAWVKVPELRVGVPSIGVTRARGALAADLANARATLASWRAGSGRSRRVDWALRALLTDEPWAEFVWLMFSLEQVIDEHRTVGFRPLDGEQTALAEAFVRTAAPTAAVNWPRASITLQFAALAARLSPSSGSADTQTFYRLARVRNRMLHGTEPDAPDGLTRRDARELGLRYNKLLSLALAKERRG